MMISSVICGCILAICFLLSAAPEAVAFTPWRDHSLCTHHRNHVHQALQRNSSSSPRGNKRHRISSQLRESLGKDSDSEMPVTINDVVVTGVTLKMAFDSSDVWGVANLSETKSERFTSSESLDLVHRLRRESCAVLVGRGTVEKDDCTLTVRRVELGDGKLQPVRVVIDPTLSLIGGNYSLLKDGFPTIIYHLQTKSLIEAPNENVILVGLEPSNDECGCKSFISPATVVKDMNARGFRHIMVEGGPATASAFLKAGVVDRALLVRAPIKFEKPMPAMMDESTLEAAGLHMIGTAVVGGDKIEYWTRHGLDWPNQQIQMWP
jgi:riboflavin biosynthesis pyrimidine reductase